MTSTSNRIWDFGQTLGLMLFLVLGIGFKLEQEIQSRGWRYFVGAILLLFAWQVVAFAYRRGMRDAAGTDTAKT